MKLEFSNKGAPPLIHDEEQYLYEHYYKLILDWNERINLVSRKTIGELFQRHFIDSMFISDISFSYLEERPVFDIGSGAGFPGLVFAIRYPNVHVTLYERTKKKNNFLVEVIKQLGLKNVVVKEEYGKEKLYGFFLNRALLKRVEVIDFFLRHTKVKSRFIICSGEVLQDLKVGKDIIKVTEKIYSLPDNLGKRCVEIFEICST